MYQKIDDIDGESGAAAPESAKASAQNSAGNSAAHKWLLLCVVLGFSIMLAAALWKYTQKPVTLTHSADQAEAVAIFNRIQAEPRGSIRRAKLIDFTANHPESPVINGARQQLRVMNEYEAADWAALSDIMFSSTLGLDAKNIALQTYITKWGEGLIGSRDAELAAFKTGLDPDSETAVIDRRQKPEPSPIPSTIDGAKLAGGQTLRTIAPSYPAPPPIVTTPAPRLRTSEVVPLQVRRTKRPNYPRRAYSRGIPAKVEVSYNVDTKGRVQLVKVINIDAVRYESEFARAARRAARDTRYYPKTIDGVPAPVVDVRKTYVFNPDVR